MIYHIVLKASDSMKNTEQNRKILLWEKPIFNYVVVGGSVLFIFLLFLYMTKSTPIAGDDWGYAVNGMKGNPFKTAIEFYYSWSGRFFSELWGFIVAPRKWLWNILNPLLFTFIYIFVLLLTSKKNKWLSTVLVALALILNVNSTVRMQTYTWVMGDTYVVPLMITLGYLVLAEKKILNTDKVKPLMILFSSFCCFYVGLTMENIAAVLVFAIMLLAGYDYFKNHRINTTLIINGIIAFISFMIMRSSPGSAYRLLREHAEWSETFFLIRMLDNVPLFMQYSFIENKILIITLSLVSILLVAKKTWAVYPSKKNTWYSILSIAYLTFMLFVSVSMNLDAFIPLDLSVFYDSTSYFVWFIWIIYVALIFFIVAYYIDDIYLRTKTIFFIMLGGSGNFVMLLSPIFGPRSALYFIYFIMIAVLLMMDEIDIENPYVLLLVSLCGIVLIGRKTNEFIYKSQLVQQVEAERQSIIAYHQDHPEITEIYIPRMPLYSLHSADIEEWDTYHFEVFKKYFKLNEEAKIIFYWKDSYN